MTTRLPPARSMTRRSVAGISTQSLAGAAFTASPGERTGAGAVGGAGTAAANAAALARRMRCFMRTVVPRRRPGSSPGFLPSQEHSKSRAMYLATLMLLGAGELGREFAIAAKRLGCRVVACDRYENAPAMQLADTFEVFPMLDGEALRAAV